MSALGVWTQDLEGRDCCLRIWESYVYKVFADGTSQVVCPVAGSLWDTSTGTDVVDGEPQDQVPRYFDRNQSLPTDQAHGSWAQPFGQRYYVADNSRAYQSGNNASANGQPQTAPEGFQRRHRPRDFFKFGKVFEIYWPENAGRVVPAPSHVSAIANSRFGDIYVKCRKFVVIATPEGENHCVCVPIYTYSGHGVSRSGRPKWTHSIIYTGRQAPEPLDDEEPEEDEDGLLTPPIKVNPAHPSIVLDPLSRVNFGKLQSVDHACHVRAIGNVTNERDLTAHSSLVWARMNGRT